MHSPGERMRLREALLEEHTKAQALKITEWVGARRQRFEALVGIVCGAEPIPAQRGAWALCHCVEAHSRMALPFLRVLLENLQQPDRHDAIKRNTMKALTLVSIPESEAGLAAERAFTYLDDDREAVATRVYAMTVLQHLCEQEPLLADEVILTIERHMPYATKPAFHSRARHVLKALAKIKARMGD